MGQLLLYYYSSISVCIWRCTNGHIRPWYQWKLWKEHLEPSDSLIKWSLVMPINDIDAWLPTALEKKSLWKYSPLKLLAVQMQKNLSSVTGKPVSCSLYSSHIEFQIEFRLIGHCLFWSTVSVCLAVSVKAGCIFQLFLNRASIRETLSYRETAKPRSFFFSLSRWPFLQWSYEAHLTNAKGKYLLLTFSLPDTELEMFLAYRPSPISPIQAIICQYSKSVHNFWYGSSLLFKISLCVFEGNQGANL